MEYFQVVTKEKGEEGINGGLMKRQNPGQQFTNYIAVPSIDDAMAKIEKAGGSVVLSKREIAPGAGWIALFEDTEGNVLGFHQGPDKKPDQK